MIREIDIMFWTKIVKIRRSYYLEHFFGILEQNSEVFRIPNFKITLRTLCTTHILVV